MFFAKTIGNYTVTVEINDRWLFAVDVRQWPERV